ncbi:MAG: enoyl-CoA hydratase/isomerase family protein [Acidimicrobiales bacterium]
MHETDEAEVVHFERRGRVALLTLDRPGRLNALGSDMARRLHAILDELETDPTVRAIAITGAGRAFCAGADITELDTLQSPADFARFVRGLTDALDRLAASPLPSIAAVNGLALGGGFEVALACDLRIAAPEARFGVPEIKLGVLPAAAGTQRLARALPAALAKQLIMTGEPLDAARALALGLVNEVADDALAAALALGERLADGPPAALAAAKRLVDVGVTMPLAAGIVLERETVAGLFATEDRAEGIAAFLEKRPPSFSGR